MQMVSAAEKVELEKKREELFKIQIEVQDRIRKAAAAPAICPRMPSITSPRKKTAAFSDNSPSWNPSSGIAVVSTDNIPKDLVFLGHTVRLLDLSDDTEQLVRLVGEANSSMSGDVLQVSASSPMGDALMKARVGDTVKVKAPRGTNEFKILEIVE